MFFDYPGTQIIISPGAFILSPANCAQKDFLAKKTGFKINAKVIHHINDLPCLENDDRQK